VYVREKGKDDGMPARIVADLISNDCGISLCPRTIQKKVKAGNIRYSPLRRGPKGNIPEPHYKNLCAAYESFATINQINGNMQILSAKKYGPLICNSLTPKSVLAGTKTSPSKGFWLAKHKHTNIPTMMEPFPPPAPWF
jgi:hypothetical protein